MAYPHDIVGEYWTPEFVDVNNDDYFMHKDTNKVDILYNAFLLLHGRYAFEEHTARHLRRIQMR